jgi:hypothetical protein
MTSEQTSGTILADIKKRLAELEKAESRKQKASERDGRGPKFKV